ncbi:MAG: prolipoprotein diacylglyceryl transferase [Candidatus Alcyoniella australis]|nr:prolipoprotein diacylglyceryl transferase [Candidatus Alcyoniella australis]
MHPILLHIDAINYELRSYGVAMATAFIVCIYAVMRQAKQRRMEPLVVLNTCFWIVVATLIGGRLLYLITQFEDVWENTVDSFTPIWQRGVVVFGGDLGANTTYLAQYLYNSKFWQGGLVFYGGFLGSFLAAILYLRVYARRRQLPVLDLLAPWVGLGLAIHRAFGCFLNGCCYGRPVEPFTVFGRSVDLSPLIGVHFPYLPDFDRWHWSVREYGIYQAVHPTQLYESLNGLMIFGVLLLWRRKWQRAHGELAGLLLMIYAFNRFIIEYFRGDMVRGAVGLFSTSQFIGFFVFSVGLLLLLISRRRGIKLGSAQEAFYVTVPPGAQTPPAYTF